MLLKDGSLNLINLEIAEEIKSSTTGHPLDKRLYLNMQNACHQCCNRKPVLLKSCIELWDTIKESQNVVKTCSVLVFKCSKYPSLQELYLT